MTGDVHQDPARGDTEEHLGLVCLDKCEGGYEITVMVDSLPKRIFAPYRHQKHPLWDRWWYDPAVQTTGQAVEYLRGYVLAALEKRKEKIQKIIDQVQNAPVRNGGIYARKGLAVLRYNDTFPPSAGEE